MIEVKELRSGNMILFNDKVLEFKPLYYTKLCFENDKFAPIQLTEEWLLKFGFDKIDAIHYCLHPGDADLKFFIRIEDDDDKLQYHLSVEDYCGDEDKDDNSMYLRQIYFIHQLQNLFHSLTGNELTIK